MWRGAKESHGDDAGRAVGWQSHATAPEAEAQILWLALQRGLAFLRCEAWNFAIEDHDKIELLSTVLVSPYAASQRD